MGKRAENHLRRSVLCAIESNGDWVCRIQRRKALYQKALGMTWNSAGKSRVGPITGNVPGQELIAGVRRVKAARVLGTPSATRFYGIHRSALRRARTVGLQDAQRS